MRSIRMSDLSNDRVLELGHEGLDIMRHLTENMPEVLWFHRGSEEVREVFSVESGTRRIARFLMIGEGIYFSVLWDYMAESGTLYNTSTAGGGLGSVVYLDEHVTDYIGISGGTSLAYRKVTRGDPDRRDISLATEGISRTVAHGTDFDGEVMVLGENADILAYYRTSETLGVRSLYTNGRQERFIAQLISRTGLHNEEFIYLLRTERAGQSLHIYQAGEIALISENVTDAVFFGLPG
jgi:hypothetical protein